MSFCSPFISLSPQNIKNIIIIKNKKNKIKELGFIKKFMQCLNISTFHLCFVISSTGEIIEYSQSIINLYSYSYSHVIVGLANYIYCEIYNSCEIREYTFMVLQEYSIIFQTTDVQIYTTIFKQANKYNLFHIF